MRAAFQDFRLAVRTLARAPGVTILAILTLALCIGADTALFSIVQGALLRPFPYADPEGIVWLDHTVPRQGLDGLPVSYPNFLDLRQQNRAFEQMVAWRYTDFNLTGDQEPVRVEAIRVSANLFSLLGVAPLRGRGFLPEEDRPGADRVAVIGYGLWQRRFGARPGALGSELNLNGEAYTIIGVMPPDFAFPEVAELWVPLAIDPARAPREDRRLRTIGRLKRGVSMVQAQADVAGVMRRLEVRYPNANAGLGLRVIPLRDFYMQNTRASLLLGLGAAGLLLLIACANVANLLLGRAIARRKEMAIRSALGAGRFRLVRQALAESALLAATAGVIGLLLAYWGLDLILSLVPITLPFWMKFQIDGQALGFVLCISMSAGLIFGLAPAMAAWKSDLRSTLQESGRHASGSRGQNRLRHFLVASEAAMAMVLLAGAGLVVRSFLALQSVDTGFRTRNVVAMELELPTGKYAAAGQIAFYESLVERVRRLAGVQAAGLAWQLPLRRSTATSVFSIEGRAAPNPAEAPMATYRIVSPGYFRSLDIRLDQGRHLADQDGQGAPPVAVISKTIAQRFWPSEDPIGRRIKLGRPEQELPWREIVGVVADVRNNWFGADLRPTVYVPYTQVPRPNMTLVVAASDARGVVAAVRQETAALDRTLPLYNITTMERVVLESLWRNRLFAVIFGLFAVVALVLASGGLYGVISYAVVQRIPEIGIRLALGARPSDILGLVLGQGMRIVLIGGCVGWIAASLLTRLMTGLLFEVQPADPLTLAGMALLLGAVALAACYVPAARARSIDPLQALRHE